MRIKCKCRQIIAGNLTDKDEQESRDNEKVEAVDEREDGGEDEGK